MILRIAIASVDNSKSVKIGGKHAFQELLEKGLSEIGHDVEVFYPKVSRNTFLRRIRLLPHLLTNPKLLLPFNVALIKSRTLNKYMMDFFRKLNFKDFDIVNAQDVLSASALEFDNLVLTFHGYYVAEALNRIKLYNITTEQLRYYENLLRQIEEESIRKAKHIIVVETGRREYIKKEYSVPEEKITVLHGMTDTVVFKPVTEDEKMKIRKELGFPRDAFIVLVPRRYHPASGVDYAAEAFRRLSEKNYFFVFVGQGVLKDKIKLTLKHSENVVVLDAIPHDKIHSYFKASDMVLIPSIISPENVTEGLPIAMLESMACGKVTVCTKVGGMKEVIKHMENGILVEEKDIQAIIDAINYTKENYDKLEYLRNNAREYIVSNHGYLNYAKKVTEIFQKILSDSKF